MQVLLDFINQNTSAFIVASVLLNLLLIILFIVYSSITASLKDKYKKLVKGTSGKNIEGILEEYLEKVQAIHDDISQQHRKLEIMENRISFCIQKVGIIRYNAFQDTGSDLSYSIAMLNSNNDGIIITGIHGRTETISYAKPIKDGKSTYSLSVEELQALDRAKANALDRIDIKTFRSSKEVG